MTEVLPNFKLLRPATVAEAISALGIAPDTRLCAGGTDLIVNMRHGLEAPAVLVDLSAITDLKTITLDETGLRIGAGVSLAELAGHTGIARAYHAITQAATAIAGPGHREVATVGGNLCLDTRCQYYNQSHWWRKSNDYCLKYRGDICHVAPKGNRCRAAFSGDLAPALMVCGAKVEIAGPDGFRYCELNAFYQEDGADHLTLKKDEILTSVHVPPIHGPSAYDKIRVRGSVDFPLAGVAVACHTDPNGTHHFKLAFTGTNSMPVTVELPDPLGPDDDQDAYFANLGKQVQKTVSPQRTGTMAPHYRRLSIAALSARLARRMI